VVLGIVNAVVFSLAVALVLILVTRPSKHTDYTRLRVGDCYNLTSTGYVDRVACAHPHHAEVTGSFQLVNQGGYPGTAGFQSEAQPKCQALAGHYLGSTTRIDLGYVWITPNRSAWDRGTRTVVCGLQNADRSPRSGSVRT
jgi:Septum formation